MLDRFEAYNDVKMIVRKRKRLAAHIHASRRNSFLGTFLYPRSRSLNPLNLILFFAKKREKFPIATTDFQYALPPAIGQERLDGPAEAIYIVPSNGVVIMMLLEGDLIRAHYS